MPNQRARPRHPWSRFPLGVDVGLGVALAIFLGASFAAYDLSQQAARAATEANQSYESLASIQALLTSVVDAETGQRGFLLTAEDRYLDPYKAALPQIRDQLKVLGPALAGRPQKLATLAALNDAVRDKLQDLAQTLAESRASGIDTARSQIASEPGRVKMDKIRALVQDIASQELATLQERNETARVTACSSLSPRSSADGFGPRTPWGATGARSSRSCSKT